MDASNLTGEQRRTLLKFTNQSNRETLPLDVFEQLKELGIICEDLDGLDRLSALGESICRQLAELGEAGNG